MKIEPPVILDESVKVIEWARELRNRHYSVAGILTLLLSEKVSSLWKKNEKFLEARELFSRYSPSRDNVIMAIMIDAYHKENDIREGQIVTDGDLVGFAFNFDVHSRTFQLFIRNDSSVGNYIGTYEMDNFHQV